MINMAGTSSKRGSKPSKAVVETSKLGKQRDGWRSTQKGTLTPSQFRAADLASVQGTAKALSQHSYGEQHGNDAGPASIAHFGASGDGNDASEADWQTM
jgi:hypothetical protein